MMPKFVSMVKVPLKESRLACAIKRSKRTLPPDPMFAPSPGFATRLSSPSLFKVTRPLRKILPPAPPFAPPVTSSKEFVVRVRSSADKRIDPPEPPALPPIPLPPKASIELSIVSEPLASTARAPPPPPPVVSTTNPPPPLPPSRLVILPSP